MNIENNILKYCLRNAYFITGTAYAGKSTMVKMLAERYGMTACGENYHMAFAEKAADPVTQPNLCYFRTMKSWEEFVRRTPEEYERWIYDVGREAAGIEVVTHVILGLPGESREDMLETVRYVGRSGADGIKLQLLHVLEGTDLADDWRAGKVPVMTMEEYISLLEDCLAELPPDIIIHRLTGDGAKRDLLAPLWTGDKKRVLNAVRAAFDRDGAVQGSRWQE